MGNVIIVFSNRNQSMRVASILKRNGINVKTVSTPREISISCGVSVVFPYKYINEVKNLIRELGYYSSSKFYLIVDNMYNQNYKLI